MTEKDVYLEGIPAVIYLGFWQTREMGFLKQILNECKIYDELKILFFADDWKPGALITLDGKNGDFTIVPVDSIEGVEYDGAIIGKIGPIIKYLEGNILLKGFWHLITRKTKLKKKGKLLKFAKVLLRCAL